MAKKKKIPEHINGTMLIYDKDNIRYYSGSPTQIEVDDDNAQFDDYDMPFSKHTAIVVKRITLQVPNVETLDNIVLDDTTMKRIAKFNKNQEIKRLDKAIQEKQEKIKKLEDILYDREKRVDKLKEYIEKIYDINLDEDDEYEDYDW